jgi:hypothetical protein
MPLSNDRSRALPRIGPSPKRAVALGCLASLLLCLGLWLAILYATDATPYVRALDGLKTPPSWQLVRTDVHEAILMGQPVYRHWLVRAEAEDAFPSVRAVVTEAGFQVDETQADGCSPLGTAGPVDCFLAATGGGVHLSVVVFHRGDVVPGYPASSAVIGAADSSVIRIGSGPRY